jgi:hypothetical protein
MDAEFLAWGEEAGRCTDPQLMAELQCLARADRRAVARMVVYVGEVDARGLYRERAYSSMFAFAVAELRMSEAEAYLRILAGRVARQYPVVIELLAQGALHLSSLKRLAPHLTIDNQVQLLERARGKSKREVEQLVAALAPLPDVPARMRKVPVPSPERNESRGLFETQSSARELRPQAMGPATASNIDQAPSATGAAIESSPMPPRKHTEVFAPEPPHPQSTSCASLSTTPPRQSTRAFALAAPRASCTPLRPNRYKLELTASQALHDNLEQLKHLLRHQVPDADLATIVERAVDLLLDKTLKQRSAQRTIPSKTRAVDAPEKPQKPRKENSRHVPRAVVREVHARDAGQCTFMSSDGRRCTERGALELHHVVPFARGGPTTTDNLQVLCRAHNGWLAEQDFGTDYIRLQRLRNRADAPSDRSGPVSATPRASP